MKTQTLIAALALAMLAGCASQKSDTAATSATASGGGETSTTLVPGAPTGTGTDPTVTGYSYGSTASIVLNGSALSRLFYNSRPVSATNPRINIDLQSTGSAVTVSYVESGVLHQAVFGSINPTNSSVVDTSLNGWVSQNGGNVWKGFFQDSFGAIVLVIDKSVEQGDGTATSILGGSVWFQNFQQSNYQNPIQGPNKMCWQITAGPYDCRSFLVNNVINMTSSLYPTTRGPNKTSYYEKLGDFGGIDRTAAGL